MFVKTDRSLDDLERALAAATDEAAPDAGFRCRAMFGGRGCYAHDRMFASLSDVGLGLKLPPDAQDELLREDGARRVQYDFDSVPSKQYIAIPERFLDDPAGQLGPWVARSVAFVASLPAPKRKGWG